MMKLSRKLFAALVLGLGFWFVVAGTALAAGTDVVLGDNVNIAISALGGNLTLVTGSKVESYSVDTTTLTLNVNSGSTVTVESTSLWTLTNSMDLPTLCHSNTDTYISFTADHSLSVTITPSSTAVPCSATGTSGGGGGGGGGSYAPPAPTPTPTPASGTGYVAPTGVSHPDGTLILDGSTVYLVQDGKRLGFRDANEYKSHGYSFAQLVPATSGDLALPTDNAGIVKALEGTLVLDSSDGKTVYMIGTGNTKRGFASAAVFKALGYSFTGLLKVNLSDYTVGPVIGDSALAHPDGALVLGGQTVWWIRGNTKSGFESDAVFKTYGFSYARVVKANAADLALPEGALVKFRDGTLVKDGDVYYLISDGKAMPFASLTALTSRGFKTSNAISASVKTYEAGAKLE